MKRIRFISPPSCGRFFFISELNFTKMTPSRGNGRSSPNTWSQDAPVPIYCSPSTPLSIQTVWGGDNRRLMVLDGARNSKICRGDRPSPRAHPDHFFRPPVSSQAPAERRHRPSTRLRQAALEKRPRRRRKQKNSGAIVHSV